MVNRKVSKLSQKEVRDSVDEFLKVVFVLESKEEVIDFFIGLLTKAETIRFGRRIKVAKLIMEDKTYREIVRELNAGKSLVSTTDKWLHFREGRYKKVLKKSFRRIRIREKEIFNLDHYPLYRFILKSLNLR